MSPPETGRRRAFGGIDGPMSALELGILGLYFLTLVILAIMGVHRYVMVYLYFKHREKKAAPVPLPERLPRVTIQLPIFNEMYVLDRLLESVVQIRYPRELLQIQVLDDSTDETTAIASRAVGHYRALGFDMQYLHRADRTGYKAGALDAGLQSATGEFVLIFDADFVAPPDVLERTIGYFEDPKVGMVQARWGHINRGYSLLTEVQSIMLDGHFIMEHGARSRSGRFFNFNGTAGVWRRAVIDDAGGWQHDTLTEDLDLSYRAQLRGWRFVYTPDLVSPAELPVEMNAFKTQQQRWAKGSVQVCKKLLPRILASDLPVEGEGRGHVPPHREPRLPADGAARRADVPGDAPPLQHGLGGDDGRGRADLPRRDRVGVRLLRDLAEGAVPRRLEGEGEVHPGCPRHRHRDQPVERAGRRRGPLRQAFRVHADAQVRHRGRLRHLEAEGLQGQGQLAAVRRARPRVLLHVREPVRAHVRARRHPALHRDLPVGLPVHVGDVAGPEPRLARAARAGGVGGGVVSRPEAMASIDTEVQSSGVRRVLWITLALNLAVSAGKVVVGHLSFSLAMVADGYHSLVDGSNNVLGLIVSAFAFRPPDAAHPYGHRKFETAATLVIGAALMTLAWELVSGALSRTTKPALPAIGILNWVVMAATIAVNVGVSWYEAREGRRLKSAFLVADATHTRADLYVSLGVVASFVAAKLGAAWADPLVAVVIAGIIAWQAAQILVSAFNVLTDRAPIRAAALEPLAGVRRRRPAGPRRADAGQARRGVRRPHGAPRRRHVAARGARRRGPHRGGAAGRAPRDRGRGRPPRARGPRGAGRGERPRASASSRRRTRRTGRARAAGGSCRCPCCARPAR